VLSAMGAAPILGLPFGGDEKFFSVIEEGRLRAVALVGLKAGLGPVLRV
jgi:hypothetical protein